MEWLYERAADNSARFVLGMVGENPLVCFGINPSTAEPNNLDPTINYVSRLAASNGYDSFVMLNVYPQRATNPNDLHKSFQPELKSENERFIGFVAGIGQLQVGITRQSDQGRTPSSSAVCKKRGSV